MRGAAILCDANEPLRRPLNDPVVQCDDTIGHEVQKVVLGRGARLPQVGFRGHDCAELALVNPVAQSEDLAPNERGIAQVAEQHVETVKDDPASADELCLGGDDPQEAQQVELARLLDRLRELRVQDIDALRLQRLTTPREASGIVQDPPGALFERHEDSWLVIVAHPARQYLHAEDCLASARPPEHDSDASPRETTIGDFIESRDTGGHSARRADNSIVFHLNLFSRSRFALATASRRKRSRLVSRQGRRPRAERDAILPGVLRLVHRGVCCLDE